MPRVLPTLICGFWLALAAPVSAQTAPRPAQTRDAATAEALFRQGRLALDSGQYQDACPRFAESQRLDPAAGTLMNLATCEEKLGKLASAWQHWREAIDALPGGDDRIPFAQSRVSELEKKLPRLTVIVDGPIEKSSRVLRDETEIGVAAQGVPLPVDPGEHLVLLRTPGRFDGLAKISVAEGESKQIAVKMGAVDPVAAAKIAEQEARGGSSQRTAGWVVGGVGAAGLVTAGVSGLVLISKRNTVQNECDANKSCSADGLDAASAGKTLKAVNTIAWVVAGAGLGIGAYLVLSSSRSKPTAVLAPSLGPTSAGLDWMGSF